MNIKEILQEARESYNGISPDTQAYVTNYDKLLEAEAAYEALFAPVDAFRNDNIKSSLMFDYTATITQSGVTAYTKVESLSDIADGSEVIITNQALDSAFGAVDKGISAVENVTASTDGTQLTGIGSAISLTLEQGSAVDKFYFKNSNGYLITGGKKNISYALSKDSAQEWTISVYSGVVSMVANEVILKYNTSSPRFTTYPSSSGNVEEVCFFKKTGGVEASYTVSNAYIRFGEFMERSVYEELLTRGTKVTFGVELALDPYDPNGGYKEFELNPVFVSKMGAKEEDTNGAYVQYAVLIPVSEKNYNTWISARSYVCIDGVKFYTMGTVYSMHSLAEYYIKNASELGITDSAIIGALGEF